jgi:co-chaperonin GroES (HSP10)
MIEPLLHRIVVKQLDVLEEDKRFKSARDTGLIIPTDGQMKREQAAVDRGIVVAKGPTFYIDWNGADPDSVKVGDEVVFARHAGKVVRDPDQAEDDKTVYIVLNDEDVISILRKKAVDV